MMSVADRFEYKSLDKNEKESCDKVRSTLGTAAAIINVECPDSREKSLAITKMEEAMFWANASIARSNK